MHRFEFPSKSHHHAVKLVSMMSLNLNFSLNLFGFQKAKPGVMLPCTSYYYLSAISTKALDGKPACFIVSYLFIWCCELRKMNIFHCHRRVLLIIHKLTRRSQSKNSLATTPCTNGRRTRSIGPDRWNSHLLLQKSGWSVVEKKKQDAQWFEKEKKINQDRLTGTQNTHLHLSYIQDDICCSVFDCCSFLFWSDQGVNNGNGTFWGVQRCVAHTRTWTAPSDTN